MFLVAYENRANKSLSQLLWGRLTPSIRAPYALATHKLPHHTAPPLPSGSGLSNFSQVMARIISLCVTSQQCPSYTGPVCACAVIRAGCGPIIWMISAYIIRDNPEWACTAALPALSVRVQAAQCVPQMCSPGPDTVQKPCSAWAAQL